jgi:uncharacterized protein YjdB
MDEFRSRHFSAQPFSREDRVLRMRSEKKAVFAAFACILLVVSTSTSCGDFFPSSKAIVAMTISPTSGLVAPSATTQFTATGTLGNNQTQDVTGQVNWSSSSDAVATITQAGLATGVSLGTVTITAKTSDVTATATLLVSNATKVTVTPATATVLAGGTQQLTAVDQNNTNITSSVSWTSSDTTQATVSTSGLVTVLSTATPSTQVTITGTLGTLTGTSTITVGL